MNLRARVQETVRRAGYIVQRWPPEGSLDRELQRLVDNRNIETVIDVGAHVGLYGQRLRALRFTGRIVSFEPSPRPFSELAAQTDDRWDAHRLALGNETTTAALHVYAAHEEFTSLHTPSDVGREEWSLRVRDTIEVPVRRLDDLVQEMHIDLSTALLKIDTQGHDAAVLDGGEHTARTVAGLQLEMPATLLYKGAASFDELLARAQGYGFALLGLFPVHEHPRPLVPIEFDGLFARRQ